MKTRGVKARQEPSAMTDQARTVPAEASGTIETFDLLRVALAAYAAHLAKRGGVLIPGAATPWGRSARIANLRQFHKP
jgi:hypothetical protein